MLLLCLKYEAMSRSNLLAYFDQLCAIARDPDMSSEERRIYRAVRKRVATLIAFPR